MAFFSRPLLDLSSKLRAKDLPGFIDYLKRPMNPCF